MLNLKKVLFLSISVCFALSIFAQSDFNLTQTSNLPYTDKLNDIWGFVDSEGTEYALVGTYDAFSIVSLENPAAPVEVKRIPGIHSTWRDVKTWDGYAYVTADVGDDGLLIVDLNQIHNDSIRFKYYLEDTFNTGRTHNIYIDEKGYAYLFGFTDTAKQVLRDNKGAVILDLNADPYNPVHVGTYEDAYLHDGYARNDTLYGAELYEGEFSIIALGADRTNPTRVATRGTDFQFTHNIWPSDDGKTVFTTDELEGANIGSYDISNINDIQKLDTYVAVEGAPIIPHNVHVLDDYVVISYYNAGVIILDAARPANLIEVGRFDTYPQGQGGGYDGCWGAYPFLPSGEILATDGTNGLFVLKPNYVRGCYFEGVVEDFNTSQKLSDVAVDIIDNSIKATTNSNLTGKFKTGVAQAGSYTVKFNKTGYFEKVIEVNLANGVLLDTLIKLEKQTPLTLNITSLNNGDTVQGVRYYLESRTQKLTFFDSNQNSITIDSFFQGEYDVKVGKWHFKDVLESIEITPTMNNLVFDLEKGIYDDFFFDLNWTVEQPVTTLNGFERGVPTGTNAGTLPANPSSDVDKDYGEECFITGKQGGGSLSGSLDSTSTLVSPKFDPNVIDDGYLSFYLWFQSISVFAFPERFDTAYLSLRTSAGTVPFDTIENITYQNFNIWNRLSYRIKDFYSGSDSVQFEIKATNGTEKNVFEVGIDQFRVVDSTTLGGLKNSINALVYYPNPFNNELKVLNQQENLAIQIFDIQGKKVFETQLSVGSTISLSNLKKGYYLVKAIGEYSYKTQVLVKH